MIDASILTNEQNVIEPTRENEDAREVGNSFPEIYANSPLENTTLVYSIPTMGEWHNGNLLRTLRGFFSQHQNGNEAFELDVLMNIGRNLDYLTVLDNTTFSLKTNEKGQIELKSKAGNEDEEKAIALLRETQLAVFFLKKIIEAQQLVRTLLAHPNDTESRKKLLELIGAVTDPIQKDVLLLSLKKANTIGLTLIDATHTSFSRTPYHHSYIASLRTLGVDVAKARYESNPNVVISMYDADTIPEDNKSVASLQQIFDSDPELTYVFAGITNFPTGHSKELVETGPEEHIRRTVMYNTRATHGSPQISFRLRAYEKLQEISGWMLTGFQGDEDYDTAYRLIYHFGLLQDGLLFEHSLNLFPPTYLTADRLDGSVDSVNRKNSHKKNEARFMSADMSYAFTFSQSIYELIAKQSDEKRQQILEYLNRSREYFGRKQELQQRMNRVVLGTFIDAYRLGYIKVSEETLETNSVEIMKMRGGTALAHYIEANQGLVRQILMSPEDLHAISYYLGKDNIEPPNPTTFQLKIREYICPFETFERNLASGIIAATENPKDVYPRWVIQEKRKPEERISLMHSTVAELLALGQTYKTFFETPEFLSSRNDSASKYASIIYEWPLNPNEQKLNFNFGNMEKRVEEVKEKANVKGTEIDPPLVKNSLNWWLAQIQLKSFPIFQLFQFMTGGKRV